MHPARSLVLFTTLSGIGLGLAFWTGIGALGNSLPAVATAAFLAVAFGGGGLLASVFHLRRPDPRCLSPCPSGALPGCPAKASSPPPPSVSLHSTPSGSGGQVRLSRRLAGWLPSQAASRSSRQR